MGVQGLTRGAAAFAAILAMCIWSAGCTVATERDDSAAVSIDAPRPTGEAAPTCTRRPRYRTLSLKRDPGSDFAYSFDILVLEDEDGPGALAPAGGIDAAVKREFRKVVLKDYAETFAVTNVVVDFPVFERSADGCIKGRALVISATPTALLDYDAHTRRGRMTVRFNTAIGTDAARAWARQNIESLARDKNILLTSGTRPPEGHYVSLGEKWRENTLEIEFKTE